MDQALLVSAGHLIVRELDSAGLAPRAAMWVHGAETDLWKLWLVPSPPALDQRRFYRALAEIVSRNRNELGDLDASDAELVAESHPAIGGLRRIIKMTGEGSARFTNMQFNGFFLPDGIVLRMNI